ncbi:unnamed protein product [Lepeophtheirus salmonis]|nr:unnamed protein product [Lepeophtheirus salmonis]CAF3023539.1 unnamed protein product [Lepeophtheirus salmonis]
MNWNIFALIGFLCCFQITLATNKQQTNEGYQVDSKGEVPEYSYKSGCKYQETPWSDCDPFEFVQWRVRPLINGGAECEPKKNDTKQCGLDQLAPGTKWLLAEHKKCISELEHLKDIIGDLHRWVDLIHERGQAMFNAFNELKKHLEDIQQQIIGLHRVNHDNEVIINRLKKELDEWKGKARKFQVELDELKTKYMELERQHNKMKREFSSCSSERAQCNAEQTTYESKISNIVQENRQLKSQLINAEKYKDLV